MMLITIARKELMSLVVSPSAWAVATVVQAILGYFFLIYLDYFLQIQGRLAATSNAPGATDMVVAPLFITAATVFLLVVPFLSMRLLSEEQRGKTLPLLLSAPLSMWEIVLGKFIGILGYLYLMLALTTLMPLSLLFGGGLDFGLFSAGFLGLVLLISSFAALGLFMSSLTAHPAVAAITSFGALLFLWLLELSVKSGESSEFFVYLSMLHHYVPMMKGILNTSDILYYLLFTVLFLVLTVKHLDNRRLRG